MLKWIKVTLTLPSKCFFRKPFGIEVHTLKRIKVTMTLPSRGQVQDQRQTEEEGGRAPSLSLAQPWAELASLEEAAKRKRYKGTASDC